jgi:urease accessory protein
MGTITRTTRVRWSTTTDSTTRTKRVADGRSPHVVRAAGDVPDAPAGDPTNGERPLSSEALHKLMAWLSPSFPVGAYSYSHGLEWAIEDGTVTGAAALEAWLTAILRHGAGRTDAIFFCHAYRADADELRAVAELAAAFQPSKERHLESVAQGRAFLSAASAAWPNPRLRAAMSSLADDPVAYPVAVALTAAAHDVPLAPALAATLTAFAANIVSAGVRAIPIGQTDGQRIIAALGHVVAAIADAAEAASLDDLGGAALRADIASMKHETQYTRLFRS